MMVAAWEAVGGGEEAGEEVRRLCYHHHRLRRSRRTAAGTSGLRRVVVQLTAVVEIAMMMKVAVLRVPREVEIRQMVAS